MSRLAVLAIPLVPLTFTAALPAQPSRIVPPFAQVRDMNAQSFFPWIYNVFHFQQVWDAAAIANQGATITAIAFRRDTQDNSTYTGHSYPNLEIRMGHTSVTPTTMSTGFATNAPGPMTLVFTGPYSLPVQTPQVALAPFNVRFPLQASFPFQVQNGNLLVDLQAPGTPLPKVWYTIDAEYVGQDGHVFTFGTAGTFASGESPSIGLNTSISGLDRVVPGGQAPIRVVGLRSPYPTWIGFGLSTQWWNGPLPFDAGQIGAPNNTLYVSLDALTPPLTPQPAGSRYAVDFTAPIPNVAVLAGESFYNQSLHHDPNANALQAVVSRGMQVTVGGMSGTSVTRMMGTPSTTAPTGSFLFRTGTGGPVVELTGTFQ